MIDIYFLTSNRAKFSHLKFLLEDYAVELRQPVDYGKPYEEPRILDREILLRKSVEDALKRQDKNRGDNHESYSDKIFIIEDTSVKVSALSTADNEVPGVDVKYWMKDLDFKTLDELLKRNGNDRAVEVRSDIVLYLPERYKSSANRIHYFHGITKGVVVKKEAEISTNLFYPWLDNKTFNKWFCPGNEATPISLLGIENSLNYDFRKKAIEAMLKFLMQQDILTKKYRDRTLLPSQRDIFSRDKKIVLNGPTCAGKTVLASHLARKHGFYHIEASDFMYLEFYQRHGFNSGYSIHEFAKSALDCDKNIVSRNIIKFLSQLADISIVITGFRSPDEMDWFFNREEFHLAMVNASPQIRYLRDFERKRFDANKNYQEFLARDLLQKNMGLALFEKDERFTQIKNEGSLKGYFSEFESRILREFDLTTFDRTSFQLNSKRKQNLSLESSILIALFLQKRGGDYFTTTEIAGLINSDLSAFRFNKSGPINTDKNNVSRYFNQHFYPFYEVKREGSTNKFRLSLTGISHALLCLRVLQPLGKGR